MTSGTFETIPLTWITVDREKRQRRVLVKVDELAESIRTNGLMHPVLVTPDYVLVAGERRYEAHKLLQWDNIAVQFTTDLSDIELHLLELEENIRRVDLTWQDNVRSVAEFHRLKQQHEEDWNVTSTAEALSISVTHVNRNLDVDTAMREGLPEVLEAQKFTVASNFVDRRNERLKTSAMRDLSDEIAPKTAPNPTPQAGDALSGDIILPDATPPLDRRFVDVQQADFTVWSTAVQETPFNMLHVDFPYGVSAGDKKGQSSAKTLGGYDDSKDVYFNLLEAFCNNLDNFCAPSAHLIFWFSLDYYAETVEQLSAAGWAVNRFPLIWHKTDNSGILPDPSRGPRRTYETALFASRGDRKIVRAVANSMGCALPPRDEKIHMSEKPRTMLDHFFRMVVDDTTRLLDPTCGSGNAVRVAESMGAQFSLGLDLSEDYVERARTSLGI